MNDTFEKLPIEYDRAWMEFVEAYYRGENITTTRIKRKEVRNRLESLSKKFVIPPADGTD